ncbi:MAG: hypothetical protein FVQ79_07390 [Planctomycetes bacterium]|nr:hypothetical protein [Planctomycetota bacterium]
MRGILKFLSVFVCLSLFCSLALGNASGIDVVGEMYEVRGSGVTLSGVLQEYYVLGSAPVEGSAPAGFSKADKLSVFADAFGDDEHNPTGTWAAAQFAFMTDQTTLGVHLDGFIWYSLGDTYVSARLMDVTSADMLYEFRYDPSVAAEPAELGGNSYFDVNRYYYGLDTSHLYQFTIEAHGGRGNGGTALLNAQLSSVSAVPVPSALMLCGVGMCITSRLRRKKILH